MTCRTKAMLIVAFAVACAAHASAHGHAAPSYVPDPQPERVKTVVFITIPPEYYADRAEFFAQNGIDGIMMAGIMHGWESDIWQQPTRFTPDAPRGRIVGEENPLLQTCRRMNERCREAGIRYNSIKVAFYRPLPDWFDDEAWAQINERFRQCAIFARDAGFAGVSLDVEYVHRMYELEYAAYQAPGYPRDRLLAQAKRRGHDLMAAMIREYPEMINWHLPETPWTYGPVGVSMFVGMVEALAEADAPGGLHLCVEATYGVTDPTNLLVMARSVDLAARKAIQEYSNAQTLEYWMRRGTVSIGMWPLGYCRAVVDSTGKVIGWTGKEEKFGGRIVGSYADKSENYSPEEFRRQYAAARMLARQFVWIYGHGPVFWQMTPEEMKRYHGAWNDTLPTVENLDEYFAVLRERKIFADTAYAQLALSVRERRDVSFPGFPPRWWHIGPFPHDTRNFARAYPPEEGVDLRAAYPAYPGYSGAGDTLRWHPAEVDFTGFVDLKEIVAGRDSALAYSVTWLENPTPRRVFFRVGSNDRIAVFLNGQQVYAFAGKRTAVMDHDVFAVDLPVGRSEVLVKCANFRRAWGFYFRVTDEAGNAVPGLRWVGPPKR